MQIAFGAGAAVQLTATETIVASATWMFQTKVRLLFAPFQTQAASTSAYCELAFCLNATSAKQIGFFLTAQCFASATPQGFFYPLTIGVFTGTGFGTTQITQMFAPTGVDLRIRIGLQGSLLIVQISNDAYNWLTVYSETYSSGPSFGGTPPTSLILRTDNLGGSGGTATKGAVLAAFDYVRMVA
jgi:hypothetical protein